MPLAELAAGLNAAMWKLYDRKYGKYGEARVKALQKEIVRLQRTVDGHLTTIRSAEELVRVLEQDLDDADREIAGLKNRLNEAEARGMTVELPANPYAETVTSDGEVPR